MAREEKRKFCRANYPCKVILGFPTRTLSSQTENIGEGGIKLFLKEKLDILEKANLEIIFNDKKTVKCRGKVAWLGKNPDNPQAFDIGIQFIEINDSDKQYIKNLVDRILANKGL